MKKQLQLVFMLLILLAMTACVGANADTDARVKCPACGYEFNVDSKS